MAFADGRAWSFHSLDALVAAGRVAAIVDRRSHTISFTYDSSGRLTTMTAAIDRGVDPLGREIGYGYDDLLVCQSCDDALRLIARIDPNGNTTCYVYDALDHRIVTRFAEGTFHLTGAGATWLFAEEQPDSSGSTASVRLDRRAALDDRRREDRPHLAGLRRQLG